MQKAKGKNKIPGNNLFISFALIPFFLNTKTIACIVFLIFALCLLPFALFSFSRHHAKATKKKLDLIGKVAIVQTELSPKGAVLTDGELWLAQTNGEEIVAVGRKVRIVKTEGHLLQVDSI